MKTVGKAAVIEFEEKKSKFIGYIKPVVSVAEAEVFIREIKDMHPNATHNVPVYRVIEGGQEYLKYSDDGEPSGTAAKPMADIAALMGVFNFALVATRYFGGIKLGSGGLVRAYAKTAKLAIYAAEIVTPIPKSKFKLTYEYHMTSQVNGLLYHLNAAVLSQDYGGKIEQVIEVLSVQDADVVLYGVDVEKLS